MKHQRNFLSSILKFILITAAVLILLLFVSSVLFSFCYKDIFLHFFQRDVSVGKVTFDIAKQKLSFTDISWGIPDGENLLTAKEIQITPDLKKILKLQIAFEQVLIDGVKTFVIQNGNNYKLPPFLPERKDSTLNFKIPKISISFSGITLSNSTVHLRRNGKDYRFLSELNIMLPNVGAGTSEIKPVISGNLNRKPFNFVGKTRFNENGDIINQFQISSHRLNIAENKIFLPVFPGINMEQGVVDLDVSVEYIIRKKRKSSLIFSGTLAVQNLALRTKDGQIANRLSGRATVNHYDFTQRQLDVQKLSITSGNINLPQEMFSPKKNSGNEAFEIEINETQVKNLTLEMPEISLRNINGSISDFSKTLKGTTLKLSAGFGHGEIGVKARCNGLSEFEFDELSLKNIYLPSDFSAVKKIKELKNINIDKLFGSGRLRVVANKNPEIDFSGEGSFSDIECEFDDKKISAENIALAVKDLNTKELSGVLQNLQIAGLTFQTPQTYLSQCNLELEPGEHALKFSSNFALDETLKIKEISGAYGDKDTIAADINNAVLDLKLQTNKNLFNAEATLKIGDSGIYYNGDLCARLRNANVQSVKISNNKNVRVNIDRAVTAEYLYLKTELNDLGSLKIAGIPLFGFGKDNGKDNKEEKRLQIHLSRLDVNDGEIDFVDERKDSISFFYAFTGISWKSNNLPSFIYPQGSLTLSGKVDGANPFSLQLTTSATEIKGNFSCSNALLSPFSGYAQKYLGHTVRNGRLSMNIPFYVTPEKISSDVELKLIKPELKRQATSSFPLNLDKTLRGMMNRSGMIDLKLPVTVLLAEKKVKYLDLFFEVLSKTLQSSSDKLAIPIQEEIIYDNVFSIAYFKGGSSNISGNNFLSEKMLEKIDNHKNVFTVNGFVDKQNDTEYLKRELVAKMLKKYLTGEGETARKEALKQLLQQEYDESVSDDEDSEVLLQRILSRLTVSQDDFRALAFARANVIADYLADNYNIQRSKIFVREDNNIFENPYVSGISNSIAVIRSGRLVE